LSSGASDDLSSRFTAIRVLATSFAMLPGAIRWRWAILAPIAFLRGTLEAVAAAAVFALIKIISDPPAIANLPVVSRVAAMLPWRSAQAKIVALTGLVAVFYLVKNLFALGMDYFSHEVVGESVVALKSTMMKGYLAMPYPFFLRRNSTDLIWNVDAAVNRVCDEAMSSAVAVVSEVLAAASIAAVLVYTAPKITLIAACLLGGGLALLLRLTRAMAHRYGSGRDLLSRGILRDLQQTFGGVKEIKVLGRESFFVEAFEQKLQGILKLGYLATTLEGSGPLFTETLFVGGALVVIALLSARGAVRSEGLPLLALFSYAAFRIVPSVNRIGWRINLIRGATRSASKLHDDYLLIAGLERGSADVDDGQAVMLNSAIEFERVSFTYAEAEQPVLHEISLTIRSGESIGIVGATGAGKSTLADLLVGLLRPSSGRILIDGRDLSNRRLAWKHRVGYVPQSIFLLDDSLTRNIAFGFADAEIDLDRVRAVVRMVQLDQLVATLPAGLDTAVGERGVRLSGGERQRVGLARALYHDPDLLVFDEATSALDQATEAEVSRAIESLQGRKTLLVIAHRLATVRHCDRLVFIAQGRIRACGSYDELMRDVDEFRRMAAAGETRSAG
jgi:ABC-type multidrug transport system fused ATPase/permease subunit